MLTMLTSILLLTNITIAPHQTSETTTATGSVTVATFVDITVTDRGASGINFGSLDPATNNNPEAAQTGSLGAVNFTVEPTTNKGTVNVKLNATSFSGTPGSFDGNVTADDDANIDTSPETGSSQIQLTTVFPTLKTLTPGQSQEIWFWMDVPSAQGAGSYTSTFSFKGD